MLYGLILAEKNELCQILCLLFKNMHFRHRCGNSLCFQNSFARENLIFIVNSIFRIFLPHQRDEFFDGRTKGMGFFPGENAVGAELGFERN